jgi:uncharacterized membrane protein
MPDIGVWHPQIVHFVIALLGVGVICRWIALTGRLRFTGAMATTLIVLGTLAAVVAVQSGDDAHTIPERIPGARDAIVNHEDWGNRTRNLFLVIAVIELLALGIGRGKHLFGKRSADTPGDAMPWRNKAVKGMRFSSGILGLLGLFFLYETGEHGGEVVYEYAGGVGTRSGDPQDVERLLVAALYHNAMKDREAGRKADASRLIGELERRMPNDPQIRLLSIESQLLDREDALGALAALRGFAAGADEALRRRAGLLRVDAFQAAGQIDSAMATIQALQRDFPDNASIRERAGQLR